VRERGDLSKRSWFRGVRLWTERGPRQGGLVVERRTLSGRVLAPKSRRGSLNLRLLPSILILRVTKVSWLVAAVDAMIAIARGYMHCVSSFCARAVTCCESRRYQRGQRTVEIERQNIKGTIRTSVGVVEETPQKEEGIRRPYVVG